MEYTLGIFRVHTNKDTALYTSTHSLYKMLIQYLLPILPFLVLSATATEHTIRVFFGPNVRMTTTLEDRPLLTGPGKMEDIVDSKFYNLQHLTYPVEIAQLDGSWKKYEVSK